MRLAVKQLKNRDPGSGMAVVDRTALSELGVSSGDFVAIEGEDGRAVARVWPSDASDAGRGILRIDGQLRQAAGARIDDRVSVEPTEVQPAERLTIALPQNLRLRGDVESYVRDELVDQAVTRGQQIPLRIGFGTLSTRSNRRVPIQIVDTEPSGPVVVQSDTEVRTGERGEVSIPADDTDGDESMPTGVTYEDIGGLDEELDRVREMIELPMRHPELFQTLGIEPPRGVLLHGPPGTGKTLLAKAVANEAQSNVISVKGPELFDKYVGESEKGVREIFEIHTRDKPLADDVSLADLAARTEGYVGADIETVCREAATIAVHEYVGDDAATVDDIVLTTAHFERALDEVDASEDSGQSSELPQTP